MPETAHLTTESPDTLYDLSYLGVMSARGADAEQFLQGQLTNDVARLSRDTGQLSAYCSPQGRMLALLRLFRFDEGYGMLLPRERLAAVLRRLQMFTLRADVELAEASDVVVFGSSGGGALERVQQAVDGLVLPDHADAAAAAGGVNVLRIGLEPRLLVLGPAAALRPLRECLAGGRQPATATDWRLLDIRAGIPSVYDATADQFVPQMTNLHALGGVSFQKGCYVGQEVIARSQYLGRLKRRMVRLEVHAETPPLAGEKLFTADGAVAGHVVDAVSTPQGREALAVVMADVAEQMPALRAASGGELHVIEAY